MSLTPMAQSIHLPAPRPRSLLTMEDMGHGSEHSGMDHSQMNHETMPEMDHSKMSHETMPAMDHYKDESCGDGLVWIIQR